MQWVIDPVTGHNAAWISLAFHMKLFSKEEATPRRSLSVTSGDLYSPSVRFFFLLLLLGPMPMRNGGGGGDAARGRFDQLCVEKHKTKYSSFHLQGPRDRPKAASA